MTRAVPRWVLMAALALSGVLFSVQTGSARNFYQESIDRNLAYLASIVGTEREHRLEKLRRGQVVEKVLEIKGLH